MSVDPSSQRSSGQAASDPSPARGLETRSVSTPAWPQGPALPWPFPARLLLALISGLAFYLISTPMPLDFLQWVTWVPLLLAVGDTPRRDFLLGWMGGMAMTVAGFYWIVYTVSVFSNLPWPVAVLILLIFSAYGGLLYGFLGLLAPRMRARFGRKALILMPAAWVCVEWLFPVIFPFTQGDPQFRNLRLFQLVSVTGVPGISYLVILTNLLAVEAVQAARGRVSWPWRPALGVAAVFALLLSFGTWRMGMVDALLKDAPRVKVGLIQSNYGVQERRASTPAKIFARLARLSEEAIAQGATLLIWGEGSSPYTLTRGWKYLTEFVQEKKVDLIAGSSGRGRIEGETRSFNRAFALHAGSEAYEFYDKKVLLAFGEYVPFSDRFPQLKGKVKGIGDFTPGKAPGTFAFSQPAGQVRPLMLICYEAILPGFVRQELEGGANLLVNITHDAWFGDTAAPHQFLMLVVPRAIESGLALARVANTGISTTIDPAGRIGPQTPLFKQAVQVAELTITPVPTFYRVGGRAFLGLCALLAGGALVLFRRGREKSHPAAGA